MDDQSQDPQRGPIPSSQQPQGQPPTPKKRRRWPWIAGGVFAVVMVAGGIGNAISPSNPATTSVTSSVTASKTTVPPTTATTTAAVTATATTTIAPPVTSVPVTPSPAPMVPAVPVAPPGAGGGGSCGPGSYVNASGNCVRDPVSAPAPPPGATAKCNDGTYSSSQHRSGTCSSHGGVAAFL